jgi:hypothetical protein
MATGGGLDAQFGTKIETTVGTEAIPVTNFFPFNSSELAFSPSYIDNPGLMAGVRFKDVNQVGLVRKAASGKFEVPVMMKGWPWWLRQAIGSTTTTNPLSTPTLITGSAYKQVHWPGGLRGITFTTQVGKPEPGTGNIKPLTYYGCKLNDWELTFADNAITLFSGTIDAWNEDNAPVLAAASYPSGNQAWNFSHVNVFNVGGTASTASNVCSISGGTTVPSVVTKFSLAGNAALANERFGLGNAGVKKEQLENDFFSLSGTFEGEYDSTTWDSPFRNNTTVALQVTSTGPAIGSSNYMIDIVIPAAKINSAPAVVSGPDLVKVSGGFQVYSDGVNPPIQITIISTDSAAYT